MKKFLVLLTVLGMLATPAMAGTHLEKGKAHKQMIKHHVAAKHHKKHVRKKVQKRLAKRSARKHKVAV